MMLRAATLIGALLALAIAAPAQERKDEKKIDEKLLVGKWKLTKIDPGELPDGVEISFEAEKDGKFKLTTAQGEMKDVVAGKWKLDGAKITFEFTEGRREGTSQTDTIKELTEKKLVLLDEGQVSEYWERIEEKKKK